MALFSVRQFWLFKAGGQESEVVVREKTMQGFTTTCDACIWFLAS
jgi:hypothetical protein